MNQDVVALAVALVFIGLVLFATIILARRIIENG